MSRSSALYRLAALQLFSSFKALSLAGFLLKFEWGIWVICALAVACRAFALLLTMFLPPNNVVMPTIEGPVGEAESGVETGGERRRYRDIIGDEEPGGNSSQNEMLIVSEISSLSPINTNPLSPFRSPTKSQTRLLLSLVFLITFSLRIHILYPQFTSLSQNLPYYSTTTIYSFCLLGASLLLYAFPRILGYIERKRRLRVLFLRAEEDGVNGEREERVGIETIGENNDAMILKWSLLANVASLILLALPTTKGVVFWMAIAGSVAGSPAQVALLALGSSLVGSEAGDEEAVARYINTTTRIPEDLELRDGKGGGNSKIEELYVKMGMIDQIAGCLATGVWSLGFARGMRGEAGFVDLGTWDFWGWMGERAGFVLAAGLLGLGLLTLGRLIRGAENKGREGRIVLY